MHGPYVECHVQITGDGMERDMDLLGGMTGDIFTLVSQKEVHCIPNGISRNKNSRICNVILACVFTLRRKCRITTL